MKLSPEYYEPQVLFEMTNLDPKDIEEIKSRTEKIREISREYDALDMESNIYIKNIRSQLDSLEHKMISHRTCVEKILAKVKKQARASMDDFK